MLLHRDASEPFTPLAHRVVFRGTHPLTPERQSQQQWQRPVRGPHPAHARLTPGQYSSPSHLRSEEQLRLSAR
jgi:hypothetical protein